MNKNILIALLILLVLGEGAYIVKKRHDVDGLKVALAEQTQAAQPKMSPPPKPMLLSKGMKLADNPIAKNAYLIAPGIVSDTAKTAMVGFAITSKTQADGTTVVNLAPKDADDQSQQYILKKDQTLYFIEQTPADDQADQDKDLNYRDDYGVILDQNGIVQ